ncbi:hemolysin activation/secretion protein [Candidatus Scalindua japonica]|uniref:Hemolysin activation/secretion protein n=1 Tax=Candidatus Scalindua japonica TaxID=1284222 RepID=A0A286TZ52_9BACT|nr:hemolysin activation/secretion protein [Candidatus Scalindua japonica]
MTKNGIYIYKLSDTHLLVEFSDNEGQVYKQIPIHQNNLLVLHQITENLEVG